MCYMMDMRNEQQVQESHLIERLDAQQVLNQKANDDITEKLRRASELAKQESTEVKAKLQMLDSANRKGPPSDVEDLGPHNPEVRPTPGETNIPIAGRLP